jgi:glycosyltransferase involved in cell wall biosynthesis
LKLSVVIPSFNSGTELKEAIQSVLGQHEIESGIVVCEIILVDDASAPEFQSNLKGLASEFEQVLTLIQMEKNSGPAAARNKGIKASSGSWVGFVDADDRWPKGKLTQLMPLIHQGNYDVVGGRVQYFSRNGAELPNIPFDDLENKVNHVHLGALLVRKEVFSKGLFFDESLRYAEDTDWWIRIREKQLPIYLKEEVTLEYHLHGSNLTSDKKDENRDMLRLIHLSLQRRRAEGKQAQEIPSIKEFTGKKEKSGIVIFDCKMQGGNAETDRLDTDFIRYQAVRDFKEGLLKSMDLKSECFVYFSEQSDFQFAEKVGYLWKEDPYLGFISRYNRSGSLVDLVLKSSTLRQVFFGKNVQFPTSLSEFEYELIQKGVRRELAEVKWVKEDIANNSSVK